MKVKEIKRIEEIDTRYNFSEIRDTYVIIDSVLAELTTLKDKTGYDMQYNYGDESYNDSIAYNAFITQEVQKLMYYSNNVELITCCQSIFKVFDGKELADALKDYKYYKRALLENKDTSKIIRHTILGSKYVSKLLSINNNIKVRHQNKAMMHDIGIKPEFEEGQ